MALPDDVKKVKKPLRIPIELFIGGDGQSFLRSWTLSIAGNPVDLTGVTPVAEIRTLDDSLICEMTATITDAVNGVVEVSMTRETSDAIAWPDDGALSGQRAIRGRWHLRLDDGSASIPLITGDVWVTR